MSQLERWAEAGKKANRRWIKPHEGDGRQCKGLSLWPAQNHDAE
jgi:hypothetical protein